MTMTHRVRTLGRPQLLGPYGDVDLRFREAALLAFLCEHPSRAVPRSTIAALFWPNVTHTKALRSLSQLLYQIRGKIPSASIVSTPQSLTINNILSDLDDIRSAVDAAAHARVLALFRGPFLGEDTSPSHDLDLWRDQINREVAGHVSEALQQHMAALASPHDLVTIMECCDRLMQTGLAAAADYCIHIVACLRAGRQKRAERIHSEMCAAFADITIVPTFEHLAALARKVDVGPDPDRRVRFVGRAEETQQLLNAWKDAVRGVGQVVTILGEAVRRWRETRGGGGFRGDVGQG